MLSDPKSGIGYAYGEKLPSAHVNTVWAQQPNAWDAIAGGSYAATGSSVLSGAALEISRTLGLTGNVDFDGCSAEVVNGGTITWMGTTALPKIGTRTYPYPQPLIALPTSALWASPAGWIWSSTHGEWVNNNVAGGAWELDIPLSKLPNLGTLTGVRIYITGSSAGGGGGGHGANEPGTLPTATLMGRVSNSATAVTVGALVTDTPGSAANYDTIHVLSASYDAGLANYTWSGLSEALTSSEHYWIRFTGEAGANADDLSLAVLGVTAFCECTEIGPG